MLMDKQAVNVLNPKVAGLGECATPFQERENNMKRHGILFTTGKKERPVDITHGAHAAVALNSIE